MTASTNYYRVAQSYGGYVYVVPGDEAFNDVHDVLRTIDWLNAASSELRADAGVENCSVSGGVLDALLYDAGFEADGLNIVITNVPREVWRIQNDLYEMLTGKLEQVKQPYEAAIAQVNSFEAVVAAATTVREFVNSG